MDYKYQLQKYSGRSSRHTCPACGRANCFTLYVDGSGNLLSKDVGKCSHLNSCGYHKAPKDYFTENPQERRDYAPKPMPQKETKTDYIPFELIQRSEGMDNTLMDYLRKYFDEADLRKVTADYHLGCTKNREIIFPQIDRGAMCRTGKVMSYGADGHRVKGEIDKIDWLHARLMKQQKKAASDFHLKQCLFGEHLLNKRPDAIVCLTEGEKSAVICSIVFPQHIWVSVGGKMNFKPQLCQALSGRNVIVYPDADAVDDWKERAKDMCFFKSIKISDWARNEPQGSKRDIADLIMEQRKPMEKPTTIGDFCQWMKELGIEKGRVIFNV